MIIESMATWLAPWLRYEPVIGSQKWWDIFDLVRLWPTQFQSCCLFSSHMVQHLTIQGGRWNHDWVCHESVGAHGSLIVCTWRLLDNCEGYMMHVVQSPFQPSLSRRNRWIQMGHLRLSRCMSFEDLPAEATGPFFHGLLVQATGMFLVKQWPKLGNLGQFGFNFVLQS